MYVARACATCGRRGTSSLREADGANPQSGRLSLTKLPVRGHPPVTRLQSVAHAKGCRGNKDFPDCLGRIHCRQDSHASGTLGVEACLHQAALIFVRCMRAGRPASVARHEMYQFERIAVRVGCMPVVSPRHTGNAPCAANSQRISHFVTPWTFQKRGGVIRGPLAKGSGGRSGDVGHGGGHERRLSDRRPPRGQQHVHDRTPPATRHLAAEILRRQLLELNPAPDGGADDTHLFCLTQ